MNDSCTHGTCEHEHMLWRHHCAALFPEDACTFQQRREHSAPHLKLSLISATQAPCHRVGCQVSNSSTLWSRGSHLSMAAAAVLSIFHPRASHIRIEGHGNIKRPPLQRLCLLNMFPAGVQNPLQTVQSESCIEDRILGKSLVLQLASNGSSSCFSIQLKEKLIHGITHRNYGAIRYIILREVLIYDF